MGRRVVLDNSAGPPAGRRRGPWAVAAPSARPTLNLSWRL